MPMRSNKSCIVCLSAYLTTPFVSVDANSTPSTVIAPPSIVSNCPKQRRNVDLPEPDGPIMDTISPLFICKETSFKTTLLLKCFSIRSIFTKVITTSYSSYTEKRFSK